MIVNILSIYTIPIMYPSKWALFISGIILGYVIVMMIYRSQNKDDFTENFSTYMLFMTLAMAIGIHGLGHAYAEVNFGFNPLQGKWDYELTDNQDTKIDTEDTTSQKGNTTYVAYRDNRDNRSANSVRSNYRR